MTRTRRIKCVETAQNFYMPCEIETQAGDCRKQRPHFLKKSIQNKNYMLIYTIYRL